MMSFRSDFLELALRLNVLRFGEFKLKSGRLSPYFFNAGLINTGAALAQLGDAYADTLVESGLAFDMLYGPAYKGIALASASAIALARKHGRDLPFAFNRKEAKDHGEGGVLIGAPLKGRVVIVDDVISAGTSVRESVALIRAHGAEPAAVLIAIDRQERGQGALSAADEVRAEFDIPVLAIANLTELLSFAATRPELAEVLPRLQAYRAEYGA
ncbi:MAG: orotate phosphoribosyltransferase [Xanthomonadales bacterium]|nr:orotate phosphoribosyltransferase [Xanthomonadales bacterium]